MKASSCWLLAAAVASGCAHHHGNNYAYAPPYAPPVYPQPPMAQPVSAAPVATAPVVTMPGPAAAPAGVVMAGQSAPCPDACADGAVTTASVVMDGAGQTPPCPPGP